MSWNNGLEDFLPQKALESVQKRGQTVLTSGRFLAVFLGLLDELFDF